MKFSIIICGYNEEKNLDRCIQSCLKLNYPKKAYEIIYVDNNSNDASINIARKYPIKVFLEVKSGPSEARNLGIEKSLGEILLFLDADTKIDSEYLNFCNDETFVDTKTGAGIGMILPFNVTWISNYLGVALLDGYPRFKHFKYMRGCPSCNLAIRKNVLKKVGNFLEKLQTTSNVTRFSEDKELCERIFKSNYNIIYNPHTFIFHDNTSFFLDYISTLIKGSLGRATMIKMGMNDPLSVLFRFNIPIIYFLIILLSCVYIPKLSLLLFMIGGGLLIFFSIKSAHQTGLFFQSLLIKPWMDGLSLIITNFAVLYKRIKND